MALEKIDHIGIAVINLEESIAIFEKLLGSSCYKIEEVENQGVRTAFFKVGEIKLELVSTCQPENSIGNFLKNRGEGLHHLAFQVDHLTSEIDHLKNQGFEPIGLPTLGAERKRIQFLHPQKTNRVLVELCENFD